MVPNTYSKHDKIKPVRENGLQASGLYRGRRLNTTEFYHYEILPLLNTSGALLGIFLFLWTSMHRHQRKRPGPRRSDISGSRQRDKWAPTQASPRPKEKHTRELNKASNLPLRG